MTTPLIAAAHGTRSATGMATIRRLIDLVRAARPGLAVDLCFLDVASPRLADRLAGLDAPAVVVPVLLSAGYHVADDIPFVAGVRPDVRVARHLGPHRLISRALADRLEESGASNAESVALVPSPSRHAEAADDLAGAAADLRREIGRPVQVLPLDDELPDALAALPGKVAVASYLLAEGSFHNKLRGYARAVTVTDPIGAHPAIAALILDRYDAALPVVT
jgi:sirohydrochlorin ferrochelatase